MTLYEYIYGNTLALYRIKMRKNEKSLFAIQHKL